MPDDRYPGEYRIEARTLNIPSVWGLDGPAGHDFWTLKDPQGKVLAELHGLATNRATGKAEAIGWNEQTHSLQIYHLPHDPAIAARYGVPPTSKTFLDSRQPTRVEFHGTIDEVGPRWDAAVGAAQELNRLNINYPAGGINLIRDTINSNSAFRTLGTIMGIDVHDMPGRLEPRIDYEMGPRELIEKLRFRLHAPAIQDKPELPGSPGASTRAPESLHHNSLFSMLHDAARGIPDMTAPQKEAMSLALMVQLQEQQVRAPIERALITTAKDGSTNLIARYSMIGDTRGPFSIAHVNSRDVEVYPPTEQQIQQLLQPTAASHQQDSPALVLGPSR